MSRQLQTCEEWLAAFAVPDGALCPALAPYYGTHRPVVEARVALIRRVLECFRERFGNREVRVFRSPGRINLRGMHVDTHGGYLNLMTHQRETVVVVSKAVGPASHFVNTDPAFEPVSFEPTWGSQPLLDSAPRDLPWSLLLSIADASGTSGYPRGHWGRYLTGCAVRVGHTDPSHTVPGLLGVVGSDLPRGAALSSSAALCVAAVSAFAACTGISLSLEERILAARDAEWYAGSRCGVSDQAAMVLGGPQELVNVALWVQTDKWGDCLERLNGPRVAFPDALRVLVINSHTSRSLSGDALVEYTRNRFAYSIALELLRQEMRAAGYANSVVREMNRLSCFAPDRFPEFAETSTVYRLLARVPETLKLSELEQRYAFRDLDRVYEQYFGGVERVLRPTSFNIRGPLLFGLAESERARLFASLLNEGKFEEAGRLMSIGHDGDRRVAADGTAYRFRVDDPSLEAYAREGKPLAECPGVYGASSPVLDALVDAALSSGALGASLTGAGIAGAVLALCRAEEADAVADSIRRRMAEPNYATLAGRLEPLSRQEVKDAVVVNHATAAAGELRLA